MILDGDVMGKRLANEIGTSLYKAATDRLIIIDQYTGVEGSEIEDLIPLDVTATVVGRLYRSAEVEFADVAAAGKPVVGQIEAWAAEQKVLLEPGWKVELSKRIKQHLLAKGMATIGPEFTERWEKLFNHLTS